MRSPIARSRESATGWRTDDLRAVLGGDLRQLRDIRRRGRRLRRDGGVYRIDQADDLTWLATFFD